MRRNNVLEKIDKYDIYTDLALEEREKYERNVEIPGVILEKKEISRLNMIVTQMNIKDKNGVKAMGKPQGTYVTIESRMFIDTDEICTKVDDHIAKVISLEIKKMIRELNKENSKVLVVGLGNKNATPDALGPVAAGMIEIKENVTCISPGVLAQTGMETYRIVKGIISEEKPDLVIAIDSLAARNISRVASTVQITNTGITPGSGIGNHRMGLNKETLGIPVIAIGVPMVVNSVTIVHDTMEQLLGFFGKYDELKEMTKGFSMFAKEEKYQFIDEIMSGGMGKMYVTPKDIDDIIGRISSIVATSINNVL